MTIGLAILFLALFFVLRGRRRGAVASLGVAIGWFWLWSMPLTKLLLCLWLESPYPVVMAEAAPEADAIVVLGGGTAFYEGYPYAELSQAADRAWHAVRLHRAKKAPAVVVSGEESEGADAAFIRDFGIGGDALVVENESRNTEENALFVARLFKEGRIAKKGERPKVLLVTSAFHMRRAEMMFRKYAPWLDVIPAASDYNALKLTNEPFELNMLLPDLGAFGEMQAYFKEAVALAGYALFRR